MFQVSALDPVRGLSPGALSSATSSRPCLVGKGQAEGPPRPLPARLPAILKNKFAGSVEGLGRGTTHKPILTDSAQLLIEMSQ